MEQSNDSPFEPNFLEPRNQGYFSGKERNIPAYRDAIRMSIILAPFAFLCSIIAMVPLATGSALLAVKLLNWVQRITNPPGVHTVTALAFRSSPPNLPFLLLFDFFALLFIVAPFYWAYKALRMRRLSRRGQIVRGQLTEIAGREVWRPGWSHYLITVKYRFLPPSGLELTGKSAARRDDLVWWVPNGFWAYSSLPKPGTSVAILYLGDHNYRLL